MVPVKITPLVFGVSRVGALPVVAKTEFIEDGTGSIVDTVRTGTGYLYWTV